MREPSIKETAFSCPHCGAFTTQHWYGVYVRGLDTNEVPRFPDSEFEEGVREANLKEETKAKLIEWSRKMNQKLLFVDTNEESKSARQLYNLSLSKCYNCEKWAIWINEDLLYPSKKYGATPNQDLPPNVLAVVEEARSILNLSAKGAAALLRLALQMLCDHLGEAGKDLDKAIASLVKKGLNSTVQKSLDIVRVIGNESVHPGVIDLNDDKDTAIRLFDLMNIIADQMITQPKHVENLYQKLPEPKRLAIEKRDQDNSAQPNAGPT